MATHSNLSIVLPSKDEAINLAGLLPALKARYPAAEIIVVDDGSKDNTVEVCHAHHVKILSHPYSKGNGAAIKTGARAASGDVLVFMDADGQHHVNDIDALVSAQSKGYDMIVGSRSKDAQANTARLLANSIYNKLASWIVGHRIRDLTSGFRVVDAAKFREFLYLLPNGFSYPTTITMAFFRAGYTVGYVPIEIKPRIGKSHIKATKDGVRFFVIIFRVGTLYSPLKLFIPASAVHLVLGLGYYGYTYYTASRFTNMSALLLTASVIIFLIGLISEQITNLLYSRSQR